MSSEAFLYESQLRTVHGGGSRQEGWIVPAGIRNLADTF